MESLKKLLLFGGILLTLLTSCKFKKEVNNEVFPRLDSIESPVIYLVVDTIIPPYLNDIDSVIKLPDVEIKAPLKLSKIDSLRIDSLQKVKFKKVTKKVNGGYIGWDQRLKEWEKIKRILSDTVR